MGLHGLLQGQLYLSLLRRMKGVYVRKKETYLIEFSHARNLKQIKVYERICYTVLKPCKKSSIGCRYFVSQRIPVWVAKVAIFFACSGGIAL
jgi:hypothetical protein